MHIPAYKPLLNHEEVLTLSTLQVRVQGGGAAVRGQLLLSGLACLPALLVPV